MNARVLKYVDTHCNIPNILEKFNLKPSSDSFHQLSKQHFPTSFESCVSVASDSHSQADTYALSTEENIYCAFGIHPLYAGIYHYFLCLSIKNNTQNNVKSLWYPPWKIPKLVFNLFSFLNFTVAWGEIGLDYHKFEGITYAPPELQKQIFIKQIKLATDLNKPIIIHTREAGTPSAY